MFTSDGEKISCEKCRYYAARTFFNGVCRRNPPIVVASAKSAFPECHHTDCCGEFSLLAETPPKSCAEPEKTKVSETPNRDASEIVLHLGGFYGMPRKGSGRDVYVFSSGPKSPGGVQNTYDFFSYEDGNYVHLSTLSFQTGHPVEFGVNGVTIESLLAVVIDRLEHFQKGAFACRENATAITFCLNALRVLFDRTERVSSVCKNADLPPSRRVDHDILRGPRRGCWASPAFDDPAPVPPSGRVGFLESGDISRDLHGNPLDFGSQSDMPEDHIYKDATQATTPDVGDDSETPS